MFRITCVVVALYGICCAMALGQNQPTKQNTDRERPSIPAGASQAAEESPAALMHRGGGSLFRASLGAPVSTDPGKSPLKGFSPFAVPEPEPKTIKKHHLVTIIIREESEAKHEGQTDVKREADLDAKVDQFIKLNLKNLSLDPGITGASPQITLSGTRNFKGEATVDRSDTVTARITAEVLDVKPNGTLVLQARKKIKTDDEEQTFALAGICRVEDITPDNTILSTQLYDLEFTKTNKGNVRNGTKQGAIGKFLDFINPF